MTLGCPTPSLWAVATNEKYEGLQRAAWCSSWWGCSREAEVARGANSVTSPEWTWKRASV